MITFDESPPVATSTLPERTGIHICTLCRKKTPAEDYFRNDHVCDACADLPATLIERQENPA